MRQRRERFQVSLAPLSVCSHPDTMSLSWFTLLLSPSPDTGWSKLVSSWKIYRFNVRCKKLLLSMQRQGDRNERTARRGWCKIKWPSFSLKLTVIVALHQTLLSFECEIQQLISTGALRNTILNLLVFFRCLTCSRSAGILMPRSLRLLCAADEAYEGISSHLIF